MRWKSFISALLWILILRSADLLITYLYTPDLGCEWNPVVSFFGASWSVFITVQALIIIFVASLMFFYFKREPAANLRHGLSFDDFIYAYFFGEPRPWPGRMLSLPANPRQHLVFNGFVFMLITILVSVFAIVHNLLLMACVSVYVDFVARYHRFYFPSCFALFIITSLQLFFTAEYAAYRRASGSRNHG